MCLLSATLLLSSESLLGILHDGELDTVTFWKSNHWLLGLTNDKDIGKSSGESSSKLVSQVDDLILTRVLLSGSDNTNTSNRMTSSDHSNVSNLKLDKVEDLASCDINLDGIVDLDLWVWELESSGIVSDGIRSLVVTHESLVDLAELESGLLLLNLVDGETTLGVPQKSEVLVSLLDLDNIHETSGECHISSDLSINSDELLHNNHLSLVVSQSVLESVSEQDDQRKGSRSLVGTSGWLGGLQEKG